MKHLSFKILLVGVLLPPILYIGSLIFLENYLNHQFLLQIESVYIGDTTALLTGTVRLRKAVNQNINQYLSHLHWQTWGIKTDVTVTTRSGTRIYPAYPADAPDSFVPPDSGQIAADNFALMNEGLTVHTAVTLTHNTRLANLLLAFFLLLSVGILYLYYRRGVQKAIREQLEKEAAIHALQNRGETLARRLETLNSEKTELASDIQIISEKLSKERRKAGRNEDNYIEEIVRLEKQMENYLARLNDQETEINALRNELTRQDKLKQKQGKQQARAADILSRRFGTLYKKLHFHDRAISGFIPLTDDMKIKCEEIIHQLDKDPAKVPVKRKVFGKKNRATVFEIRLAYNGRLYYRPRRDHTLEILTIGTKNTQSRDLTFLETL